MTMSISSPQSVSASVVASVQMEIESVIDDLMASFPAPEALTSEKRRGIIARYTAVLEGNFIYWMTAAYLSIQSEKARPILLDNLHEEVRDAHPAMLRRFAIAAGSFPTDSDALAVHEDLTKVRLFLGGLLGVQSLVTMAFFEGFIQRFMTYLAGLAAAQGSSEMEYTDVHGVCDIEHTDGLFRALGLEMTTNPLGANEDPLEGVYLLRALIETIVFHRAEARAE
ncbi:MAG: iron-containing redox enzyme family protein [Terracidiphilus sp.]